MKDPYLVLGIYEGATNEEVKQAYRSMVRKYDADQYDSEEMKQMAKDRLAEATLAYDSILRERLDAQKKTDGTTDQKTEYSPVYSEIRSLIANKNYNEADKKLNGIAKEERTAQWHFLKGCVYINRNYFYDATKELNLACEMDPSNQEYQEMRNRLNQQSTGYGSGHTVPNEGACGCDLCDVCSFLICLDCICR